MMADQTRNMINGLFWPDASSDIFPATLENQLTLGTATLGTTPAFVMNAPTGSDIGFYGRIIIPEDYVGTPRVRIGGIIDGTPALVLAFGLQQTGGIADSETINIAYETEDLASNSSWTGYADLERYIEEITITPGSAFVKGDAMYFFFYRDDTFDTQTIPFILDSLEFLYSDA